MLRSVSFVLWLYTVVELTNHCIIDYKMNCREHQLPELELSTGQVREALQCILHTILLYDYFVRVIHLCDLLLVKPVNLTIY
jgi:hypothetical protein